MMPTSRLAHCDQGDLRSTETHDCLRLITVAEPSWDRWLGLTDHDIYHGAAYHRIAEQNDEGRAFLAVFGTSSRFLAWPYLLRAVPDSARHAGRTDVTSVYGYAGPLALGMRGDPAFGTRAWAAVRLNWLRQGAVTAFTRFHPLLSNQRWLGDDPGVFELAPTVSIDLTTPDETAVRRYPRVLRQEIAAARRRGLQTERDPGWDDLPDFVAMYNLTMRRAGAAGAYSFPASYFERLRDELADRASLFTTRLADRVAAAGIFLEHGGVLHAHLVGSDPALRGLSPLKVLLDDVSSWGHSRGSRVLHLGGGRGGQADSLLEFKGRFSPERHPFSVGRWVLDETAYRRLSAESQEAALRSGSDRDRHFFPAYRAPVASSGRDSS